MRPALVVMLCILLLLFFVGIISYPRMPLRVVSHWNAAGEADGTMSRFWGVFLLPLIAAVLLVILLLVPRLDPLKENIEKFIGFYDMFLIVLLLFFAYLFCLTLAWNLAAPFNMLIWLLPALAILFYAVGVLATRTKRNWTIGFRTPWTLSSDRIWAKTHALGGMLFKIAAVVSLVGLFFPRYAILFVLLPVMLAALATMAYSYVIYRQSASFTGSHVKR